MGTKLVVLALLKKYVIIIFAWKGRFKMNYFQKNEYSIIKYEVSFDPKKVQELKKEVIENCSLVLHKNDYSSVEPDSFDTLKIRNYQKNRVGVQDGHDVYLISYDEYVYPELVSIIDELLKENSDCIYKIMHPKEDDVLSLYEEKAKEIFYRAEKTNNKEELKKLQSSVGEVISNDRKPVGEYYKRLKNLLVLKCRDTLPIMDLNRVLNFFDRTTSLKELEDKVYHAKMKTR